jgi:predicted RNA binding protein YcfA (HicA-like mRNA interferase family)
LSSHYPPLDCRDVKRILKKLGFEHRPGGGGSSHEQWVRTDKRGRYKVTVDCPKAPFSGDLIRSMAAQAGLSKKSFYDVYRSL